MLLHHIKIKITFSFLVTFCLFQANANPKIDKVISGQVEFQKENKNLTIHQRSDRAIIDWIDFSIKENETTHIQALKDDFAILNRVSTSHPSKIFGKLTSNANVYLINQNGILIGKNALIDTNKLTLSTLDIGNAAFLNADDLHFETQRLEKIVNKGKIHALDDIIILAPKIKNLNEIVSKNGSVNLLGASY
nr:Heme/hemopexin-binding protein [Candidatus Anoxychlamydiales bacterium]